MSRPSRSPTPSFHNPPLLSLPTRPSPNRTQKASPDEAAPLLHPHSRQSEPTQPTNGAGARPGSLPYVAPCSRPVTRAKLSCGPINPISSKNSKRVIVFGAPRQPMVRSGNKCDAPSTTGGSSSEKKKRFFPSLWWGVTRYPLRVSRVAKERTHGSAMLPLVLQCIPPQRSKNVPYGCSDLRMTTQVSGSGLKLRSSKKQQC
ncbi:uncharacterized protein K452DRAFT_304454 [Aplosporella prunicola CBS 121167]|uniref:Uncharacterized protein n=1 Tax=Aplosporella prunicola CBS 121167 TaxID=1176127 RepID=A0A6A6BV03_9PEZI|nr:uncharacterized protein K452DRAFT_304454 [Aplosporella prunicola CBS 121167]KAF2146491.1 hypothetical protein K452DRAFT_304454 [Aplosporella prunicola CBS 121167]